MSPTSEEALRREIVATSRAMFARGWVANHDGNLSARLGDGRLLATPTAVSKGDVEPEWLITLDAAGAVVSGTRKPFGELSLHRAAYAARPDIGVVLHAHPPHATAFAVSGAPLPHPFIAEAVVSLGPSLPVVPYRRPGHEATAAELGAALGQADVVLLAGHGVLSVGGSFEQALLRLELVEHLARIALLAAPSAAPGACPRTTSPPSPPRAAPPRFPTGAPSARRPPRPRPAAGARRPPPAAKVAPMCAPSSPRPCAACAEGAPMSSVRERRKGLGWSRAELAGRAALDPRIIQLVELDQWSEDDALWRINEVLSRAEAGEPEVQLAPVVAPQG